MIKLLSCTLLAMATLTAPAAFASERPILRAEVTAQRDVLTLADLVEGISGSAAEKALFRAPAPGETGTIQARRIADAAAELGISVDVAGRAAVHVQRATRRIGPDEIEAAVKRALELQHGVDARALSVGFDGSLPALLVGSEMVAALSATDLAYDRRSRRVSATVSIPDAAGERRPSLRVAGTVAEHIDVAVLNRALARGEALGTADFAIERRPRESVPPDASAEPAGLTDRIARRALIQGTVLRAADLSRPEIVARGETVTIVYEGPGLLLTLRGRANEGGAQGETITIANPQTKKTLQGKVVAPGTVSVGPALPGRVASNAMPAQP